MGFQVEYDAKNDCVVGQFSGQFNPITAEEYLNEVVVYVNKHDCKKFLNDFTAAKIEMTIAQMYLVSSKFIRGQFNHDWKRAVITKEIGEMETFLETTLINQGLDAEFFTSKIEGMAWLVGKDGMDE